MSKPLPPLSYLKARYFYDPEFGEIYHRRDNGTARIGDVAGSLTNGGYMHISIPGRGFYQAHRLAWYMHTGEDPGDLMIDHINGERDNNRISNLRCVCGWVNSNNQAHHRQIKNAQGE